MHKVHIPGQITEDDASHFEAIIAKYSETFENSQRNLCTHSIPPFDDTILQKYNLMERARHLEQRQNFVLNNLRREISTAVQDHTVVTLFYKRDCVALGIATQVTQILSEIESLSSERVFVIRSGLDLCTKGVQKLQQEMGGEESNKVGLYDPKHRSYIQSNMKIIYLTPSSFIHAILRLDGASGIILFEDISDFLTLLKKGYDYTAHELRLIADYTLIFGIIQLSAFKGKIRAVLSMEKGLETQVIEFLEILCPMLSNQNRIGILDLTNDVQLKTEHDFSIGCKELPDFVDAVTTKVFEKKDHLQRRSITIIMTNSIHKFVEAHGLNVHGVYDRVYILSENGFIEPDKKFFEQYGLKSMCLRTIDSSAVCRYALVTENFFGSYLGNMLRETFGTSKFDEAVYVRMPKSFCSGSEESDINAEMYTIRCNLRAVALAEGMQMYPPLYFCRDRSQCVEYAKEKDDQYFEVADYVSLMSKALGLSTNFENTCLKLKIPFAGMLKKAKAVANARRLTLPNGELSKSGTLLCHLSFLHCDMRLLRVLIYTSWLRCPTFGSKIASVIELSRSLGYRFSSRSDFKSLVSDLSLFYLSQLEQNSFLLQDYCKNNKSIHRCALLLAFFPDIAFPLNLQSKGCYGPAHFSTPYLEDKSQKMYMIEANRSVSCMENESTMVLAQDAFRSDIQLFTDVCRISGDRFLHDATGGYLQELSSFYEAFLDVSNQPDSESYVWNTFLVRKSNDGIAWWNSLCALFMLGHFQQNSRDNSFRTQHLVNPSHKDDDASYRVRGWIQLPSTPLGVKDISYQVPKEESENKKSEAWHFKSSTGVGYSIYSMNDQGHLSVSFQCPRTLRLVLKLQKLFDTFYSSFSNNNFGLEILQALDYIVQKSCEVSEETQSFYNAQEHRISFDSKERPFFSPNVGMIEDIMMAKFSEAVAALQDRSFESFCRSALHDPMKASVSDKVRYMISFLEQNNDDFSTYEARLLTLLPNMPKYLSGHVHEGRQAHILILLSQALSYHIDSYALENVNSQRKKRRADLKIASKCRDKDFEPSKSAERMKTISILSDIPENDRDAKRKTINTNVELLHATERELEDAATAVLVEPLPLKKATNLNLPLILAKALGEILDAKVGPTCLLSDYAHIQVPSKKVAEAAMNLGSFMCLGEMVHIHKNCYIVRHKNDQLTRKIDTIRSRAR